MVSLKPDRDSQNGPEGLKSGGVWQMNPTFLCSSKVRLDARHPLDQAILTNRGLIGADLSEVDLSGADLNDGCMAQNQALMLTTVAIKKCLSIACAFLTDG
jgi:hypothetical protein